MALTARQTEETFNFVMQEVIRHAKISWDEITALGFSEIISPQLVDHEGHELMMGRAAAERLRDLSDMAVEDSPYRRRLDGKAAFDSVLAGFGKEYLRERPPSSAEQDRERLAAWIECAGQKCETLTHFIPCQIGLQQVGRVTIGPVTFGPRSETLARLAEPLAKSREGESVDERSRRETLADYCESYLKAFSDVAEVTIPDCDEVTSRLVADEAVQAALNSLHLLAGSYPTQHMRGGGPAMAAVETASVALNSNGAAVLLWEKSWEGASIHSDFWSSLSQPDQVDAIDAIGVAISTIIDRSDAELLAARYLDAVSWYADAVREKSLTAAIVKYLTSMERLLWTGETGSGVTQRLAKRTAALCFSTAEWNYRQLKDDVRKAYDLRSGIVHGRLSASAPQVTLNHRLCARVSRDLLEMWLYRFGHGFGTSVTLKDTKLHLDEFVEAVELATREREQGAVDIESEAIGQHPTVAEEDEKNQ